MKKGNIISSVILICLSIFILIQAKTFPKAGGNIPGPGFFPKILAIFLIGLSSALIILSYINKEDKKVVLIDKNNSKVYLTILIITIYLILMNIVGFLISTPILLFVLILVYGMKGYIKNVIISVFITVVIYGVFQVLLTVPLPSGIIFG